MGGTPLAPTSSKAAHGPPQPILAGIWRRGVVVKKVLDSKINLRAMRRPQHPWELKERQRDGKYKAETIADILDAPLKVRARQGVPDKYLRDQRAGSLLGRLHLSKEITSAQYSVGVRFGAICRKMSTLLGSGQLSSVRSPNIGGTGGASGSGSDESLSEQAIARIRDDYDEAYSAVNESLEGVKYLRALKEVIVFDRYADLGHLKCGLNILAKRWREKN
jgi:hypothetical protein